MRFKKHFLFFIIFNFLFLFLFFPKVSLAQQIISGGCSSYIGQIYYTTGCPGESNVYVGQCFWQDCECCCPDGEGGCSSDDCCGTCRRCSCAGSWNEYQCDSADCGGNVYIKKCFGDREGTCSASNCGSGQQCCIDCHSPDLCQRCESWQRPVRTSCANPSCEDWCREEPKCKCCKECIEPPTNPQYYNDPNNNIVATHPIKLPVKLAWDDVPGWQGGWSGAGSSMQAYASCQFDHMSICRKEVREAWQDENPGENFCPGRHNQEYKDCLNEKCKDEKDEIEECNPCPEMDEDQDECYNKDEFVSYYQIEIWSNREKSLMDCGTLEDIDSYKAFLEESEFFAPCHCFFKPSYTYSWKVRGCCEENEGTCGPWSQTWNFTTERVPEPIWPYDPDWAGQEGAENVSYEDSRELRWCPMKDPDYYRLTEWEGQDYYVPLSYELMLYFWDKDTGSLTCSWDVDRHGNCTPELLAPHRGMGEILPPKTFDAGVHVIKDNAYAWKIRACRQYDGGECSDEYSQLWKFEVTEDWDLTVALIAPPNNENWPIGLPVNLKWGSPYAYSFRYEILNENNSLLLSEWTPSRELTLYHNEQSSELNILELDTKYGWRIQPCWDPEARECEKDEWENPVWFGPRYFRTTGRPPEEFYKPEDTDALIPVEFSWEKVPGAKSYRLWVDGVGLTEDIIVGANASFSMSFSEYDVRPENTYTWRVQTCALPGGEICGTPSSPQTFSTFNWQPPSGLQPEDGEGIGTKKPYRISWDTFDGPRFYRYEVELIAPDGSDPKDECENPEPIIASGSVQNPPVTLTDLRCWGQYQWTVTPCLDAGCTIHGDSATQVFDFKADVLGPDENPGLIPCGQKAFYEGRDWLDETEPCGIKHLFIIIFLLTEFLFLNVILAILVLLVLASGVIFYFSMKMGSPNPAAKVKSIWKAAGIGIGLMVFAWTITSLLLMIFGYNLGPWQVFNL